MSHTIPLARARHPMWVYEQNYVLLQRLIPGVLSTAEDSVMAAGEGGVLRFCAEERCKYTLTVGISHAFTAGVPGSAESLVRDLYLQARVYRDAGVTEVMGYQGHWRFLPEYDYPNAGMFLPDEKRQANFLLYELLCHFMTRDYRIMDIPDTADA